MVRVPKIEWDGDIAKALVWAYGDPNHPFIMYIDCKNEKILKYEPEECPSLTSSAQVLYRVLREYKAGNKITKIDMIMWC